MLHVSANYTVNAIGMIAVMTGWLSKAFRAVFFSVQLLWEPVREFWFACLCFRVYMSACVNARVFPRLQTYMYVITLMWRLVACDEGTYVILSCEIAHLIGALLQPLQLT